jgi:hypothetical protein
MTSPFGSGFPKEVTQPLAYLSPFSNKLHAYPTPQLIPRCVSLDLFLGELIPWSLLRHRLQDGHSLFHILAVFISICFAFPLILVFCTPSFLDYAPNQSCISGVIGRQGSIGLEK